MADETLHEPLSDRFTYALSFASELHRKQARKGTQIPYVSHLLAVTSLVLENGGTEDEAIAAILHDAVEDQGGAATLVRIRREFGEAVADIVAACSDTMVLPKPPWVARKRAYIEKIAHEPASVRLVSAADKLHNVRTLVADYRAHGEAIWARFNGGRETLWYYRALVDAFAAVERTPIVGELERVVAELEALAAASAK